MAYIIIFIIVNIMSYVPTIAFIWAMSDHSRTLFVPTQISLELFANGNTFPKNYKKENGVSDLNEFIDMFLYGEDREDVILNYIFNDLGQIPGCNQDIQSIPCTSILELGNIPSGLAVVQWYTRSTKQACSNSSLIS